MKLTEDIYLVGSAEFGISNEYDCHVYLIDGGEEAALIDCGVGYDTERILQNIREVIDIRKLKRVYLTHLHADHCAGGRDLQKLGIEVTAPLREWKDMQENPEDVREAYEISQHTGCYPEGREYLFPEPDTFLQDGEEVSVGKYRLKAIEVRGHSAGMLVYLLDDGKRKALFSGDYVFAKGVVGLLNCPGCDLSLYRKDIKKLAGLDLDILFPGHRMVILSHAQDHVDKAIYHMSRAFMPPSF